jgi:hypothetical protein
MSDVDQPLAQSNPNRAIGSERSGTPVDTSGQSRRSHKKSRHGCRTCKKRKIKVSPGITVRLEIVMLIFFGSATSRSQSAKNARSSAFPATFSPAMRVNCLRLPRPKTIVAGNQGAPGVIGPARRSKLWEMVQYPDSAGGVPPQRARLNRRRPLASRR